ncbi:NAD-dependent epimerase/dehydratase family protein [Mycobacterium vicinigordonae]|uniref:NAD(P)-dependent oxidoreductase n=1 Tax=Mycobacterium vicinigordonae TaxID=1719132 RepID=A0A7D6I047_9MYCO|nr:NAD(P)-dependent oxidoreductase [Mycobacterium vicinigordonae]QLL09155.1 NAD(P)-dependent oxidoreductase [Mycobacterium vicinigordonae]
MAETVLITGAFGLVGVETVRRFAADGWQVVATAHRKTAGLPPRVQTRRVDLTDADQIDSVVAEVSPDVIVHLAAVIPPLIYRDPAFARKVNVDATAALVRAAEKQPNRPRFLHASSAAVYGSRNPHRHTEPLGVDTPLRPCELYGGHKVEAEQIVRSSSLDWVILRLGGVLSVDPSAMPFTTDTVYFGSAIPADCRVHCIDVRDVAMAFAAAAHAAVVGEILLIAGDDSHRLMQGEIGAAMAAAQGMVGLMPQGLPGNPDSDDDWYLNDWMDVARAQELLQFQHHSWPEMLAELQAQAGWKRYPRRLIAPLVRQMMKRHAAYRDSTGQYADVWPALNARLGATAMDITRAE